MTKADIVNEIAERTGLEKMEVQATVEEFMKTVKKIIGKRRECLFKRFWFFYCEEKSTKNRT